jgi:hypothetical protein
MVMLRVSRLVSGLACLIAVAASASAQEPLSLQIRNGHATIKAENVPLRTILNEWARVGGTNVVGAERIAGGAPVTIDLTDVPERQALDILLRNVSGYLLALRPEGTQGTSVYNRIIIMPPSTAPRALPVQQAGTAPRLPQNLPNSDDDVEPGVVLEGPGSSARPGQPVRLPNVNAPNTSTPAPLPIPESGSPLPQPMPGTVVVTPGNPFGVPPGSSSRPGEIVPVPQQQPGQRQDQN